MAHRITPAAPAEVPLRVLPRGTALVQDYRALMEGGVNRFHGWRFDTSLGPDVTTTNPRTGEVTPTGMKHGGRVKQVDEVVVIAADDPHRAEYIRHLRDGDLWAADEATAQAAGVPFEPHFTGEHPEMSKKHGVDLDKAMADLGIDPKSVGAPALWDVAFKPKQPEVAPAKSAPKQGA